MEPPAIRRFVERSVGGIDGDGPGVENDHRAMRIRHSYTQGVAAVTRSTRTRRRKGAADAISRNFMPRGVPRTSLRRQAGVPRVP